MTDISSGESLSPCPSQGALAHTFRLDEAVEVLTRTPDTLDALLHGLSAPWLQADEGPDTWSPFNVLGHLVHGERTDWIPRLRILLTHGEARPFDTFDRFAMLRDPEGNSPSELLTTFRELRRANIATLNSFSLTTSDLDRAGRHPELGTVTLGQLLATWVAHDLSHIGQIVRVMAKRYRQDVGPWRAYLPLLDR